jgi:glycosyltransferase involved in cell wall biosynthesis
MKFIAVQTGARRGYAVPRILHEAGMLERFYTDIAGNVGLGRFATSLPIASLRLAGLARRLVPKEIIGKTTTFEGTYAVNAIRDAVQDHSHESSFRQSIKNSERWGNAMIAAGFSSATHVYSMLSEGGCFMAEAHRRGLTVVAEIYILLASERILEAERRMFPTWEPDAANYTELRKRYVEEDVLIHRTHYFVCPSEAVRTDLVDNWGIQPERTALVPYGMNPLWLDLQPRPKAGCILFVGTADLRKGIHYLGIAAEKLRSRGCRYEFRVAGNFTEQVRKQPVCKHLTFLGRVPRDHIHEEFQQADVFVLPSLAEGSAEVTYEALAAGVPLVVTNAAGSVARDRIEGCIVPERDPDALADAIQEIVEDRQLRERFAVAARARAREFTWQKYGERLVTTLRGFE